MARKDGRSGPDLMQELFEQGHRFSFIQAFRFLRSSLRAQMGKETEEEDLLRRIRVRPDLSLSFPGTDLESVKETSPGHYLVTATFLGLYGTSSPLPTFYTEDLLEERAQDRDISRRFLDLLNSRLYALDFKIWARHRLFFKLLEERDPAVVERLYSFLGLAGEEARARVEDAYGMLRYMGLTTLFPRSAEGLRALLEDAVGGGKMAIRQCVLRTVPIPEDQRCLLGVRGNRLGEASLGQEIADRMGKFRVEVGPVDGEGLHRLLPDRPVFARVKKLVGFYLDQPLDWDMKITLEPQSAQTARLGGEEWSRLGWNTWLFSGEPGQGTVTFMGYQANARCHPSPPKGGGAG